VTLVFFFFDFVLTASSSKAYGMSFTQNPFQLLFRFVFKVLTVLAFRCTHRQWFVAALYVHALEVTVNLGTDGAAAVALALFTSFFFFFFAGRFFGVRRATVDATFPICFLSRKENFRLVDRAGGDRRRTWLWGSPQTSMGLTAARRSSPHTGSYAFLNYGEPKTVHFSAWRVPGLAAGTFQVLKSLKTHSLFRAPSKP
jgi:hypothetical protein